jgi:DNA cross-link repair 1A protein
MASQVEGVKWVPGTNFIVDGFRFQSPRCAAYFLTHFHSDHTTGLTRGFDGGLIYCSPVTYRLLTQDMGLRPHVLRQLALDETVVIAGVEVTPICANHCPGAVMFLFKVPPGAQPERHGARCILHTGDFRWDGELHGRHPALAEANIHTLMLDTTYCAPKWVFPPQAQAVAAIAELLGAEAAAQPHTLFVCTSYHIGKERAYLGAAHALGWRVWVPPAKRRVLNLLGLPSTWMALLTDAPEAARIHVLPGGGEALHEQALADRIAGTAWGRVVVVRPTGWAYRRPGAAPDVREAGVVTTVGVPYSEHSSFEELKACVRALRPKHVVPTVNAGDAAKARALVDLLCDGMDLSEDRSRMDHFLRRRGGGGGGGGAGPVGAAGETEVGRMPPARQLGPAPGGPVEEDAEEESVDVSQVDVAEQRRIWDASASASAARRPSSAPPSAKRQGTIKSFFARQAEGSGG